jgi:hypothetical protein
MVRAMFEPSPRRTCEVCSKYASLTQAHHVIPLAVQFACGERRANHDHVWLCPTHHVAIHILIDHILASARREGDDASRARPALVSVLADLNVEEIRALMGLLDRFKEWFQAI